MFTLTDFPEPLCSSLFDSPELRENTRYRPYHRLLALVTPENQLVNELVAGGYRWQIIHSLTPFQPGMTRLPLEDGEDPGPDLDQIREAVGDTATQTVKVTPFDTSDWEAIEKESETCCCGDPDCDSTGPWPDSEDD